MAGTKAPTPCLVTTSPSARSAATASRTTVRLTPVAAMSSCSVGSCEPGGIFPLVMSAVSRAMSSCASERGGDNGAITESIMGFAITASSLRLTVCGPGA